jgi:hypothetical protein
LFALKSRNEVISSEVLSRRHEIGLDKAKTIVFCQNISAATEMAALLGGEVYHSDVSTDDRHDIMRRFKSGALQVICTVDMFNEGIDIPDARLVVFLRSTSSRTIFEQQLGRGLRRAPGKDKVTVLDFVANVERINFVRELGRHVASRVRSHSIGSDVQARGEAQPLDQVFSFNTFEFEDKVIELMERYDTIRGIEHLKTTEVVAMYHELGSIQKTADRFGVTWQAIKKHLAKVGIDTSGHLAAARSLPDEDIAAKYEEIGSLKKVAKHFGVGEWVIKNRLIKMGVTINPVNQKKFASPELIEAFNRLGSVRQAAEELGIGRHSAMKHLKNSGIDIAKKKLPPVAEDNLAKAYKDTNGNIRDIVERLQVGWVTIYKALDEYGYLNERPITSAVAAAAYYKYGTSTEAGRQLGVSGALISRRAKGAGYIKKYNNKGK